MRKLLITILSLIMALSVFAMVSCKLEIEDYPEHTHTYGNWEITKPTQTEEGKAQKVCAECEADTEGKEITVTLPMLTDEGYQVTEEAATCDQAGKIIYKFPYNEETIEFYVETEVVDHTWDGGKVTKYPTTEADGETTYTCSVCKATKVEPIEKIAFVDAGVATVDTQVTFAEKETITGQKKLADGIKVVGVLGATVVIDSNKKTADGITFTYRLKLGGTIKKECRYIEVNVDKACTVKVYAMSSSKDAVRNLNMYKSLEDLTETGVLESKEVNGKTLTAVEYNITEAGTYYLGSAASGINIYGIYITFPEVHNFDSKWSYNDENHYHACLDEGCTAVDGSAAHTWNAGEVTKQATCTEDGVTTYTCTVCQKTKTETITKLGHNFATKWTSDDANHYHVCLNEGCTAVDGSAAHTWNAGEVTKQATCTEDGVTTYTCTVCQKTKTEAITKLGHNFATKWTSDDANHYHVCLNGCKEVDGLAAHDWGEGEVTKSATCEEDGVKTYTCVCQKTKTEVIPKLGHNFSTEWSADDVNHYHACLNGCKEVDGSAAHEFDGGVVTKSATCKEAGTITYTCKICQKQKAEATPKLAHNFATFWDYNDTDHYHVCLNHDCEEVTGSAAHTWGEGIVTKPATCTEEGVMTYVCTVCPKTKTEVIDKLAHNYATFWSFDDVNHYHECLSEGCKEFTDSAAHTWGKGVVTKPATNTAEGVMTYVCDVCPKQKTEVISKQEHNFATEWSYNDENHYHVCLIAGCTEVADSAAHTFDDGVVTKQPTADEEGVKTYTCTVCKKTKTEAIPKLIDTDVVTQDTAITFTAAETLTAEKKLATGVKVVGKDGKEVIIESHEKNKDGITFTYRMKLVGKINADSRYIEIKAGMACKVKIYAMSSKTGEPRVMNMFKSLQDVSGDPLQKQDVLGGNNLSVLEFHITEAGTYYFGSASGGINVYGIYITKAPHAHNFDTTKWTITDEHHYHACLIEGCTEAMERTIHVYDAGVVTKQPTTETVGEKLYTCQVCGKTKTEEIPKIFTGTITSVTFSTPDGQKETLTSSKDLGNGVKAVATTDNDMVIESNKKELEDKSRTFTYRLKLSGVMNPDSRYLEVTVTKACTIKVYAMSASSKATRNLVICKSPSDVKAPMQTVGLGGTKLEVAVFTVNEAGTYYIGSAGSGINVYGIDVLYS